LSFHPCRQLQGVSVVPRRRELMTAARGRQAARASILAQRLDKQAALAHFDPWIVSARRG
jgi:hypothetical protein